MFILFSDRVYYYLSVNKKFNIYNDFKIENVLLKSKQIECFWFDFSFEFLKPHLRGCGVISKDITLCLQI